MAQNRLYRLFAQAFLTVDKQGKKHKHTHFIEFSRLEPPGKALFDF